MKYNTDSSITSCIIITNIDNDKKTDVATMTTIDMADKIFDYDLLHRFAASPE